MTVRMRYILPRMKPRSGQGEQLKKGMCTGNFTQTRFQLIPDAHLNRETIAGIRDMKLGRIRNGEPVGAPTIRFDTGMNSGSAPHINIDPKGRPSAQNPHIQVPSGVIKSAKVINNTLKYGGIVLTVAAVAIDTWRIVSAYKDDVYVRENADKIIEELEDSIQKLNKKLENSSSTRRRRDIKNTIEHLKIVLRDVKRCKKNIPVKYIKTVSSVGGGWGGGIAGGTGGAWAGAQAGAMCGAIFGPAGAAVGAPIGAVIGAIGGGIGAGYCGSKLGEAAAEGVIKLTE